MKSLMLYVIMMSLACDMYGMVGYKNGMGLT